MAKITVQNTEITVIKSNDEDYISLTDMIKAKDGDFFVTDPAPKGQGAGTAGLDGKARR